MEDKLLVLKCKRGSRSALGRIYEKYRNDLLILAITLLNETGAAEDVVHDVFVSFVKSVEKFRLTGSLKGYLLTCVANRARNVNRIKHQQSAGLNPTDSVSSETDELLSRLYAMSSCSSYAVRWLSFHTTSGK